MRPTVSNEDWKDIACIENTMLVCRISEPEPNNDNNNFDPDLDDALTAHVRTPRNWSNRRSKVEQGSLEAHELLTLAISPK